MRAPSGAVHQGTLSSAPICRLHFNFCRSTPDAILD
jgi:hypothetical protein